MAAKAEAEERRQQVFSNQSIIDTKAPAAEPNAHAIDSHAASSAGPSITSPYSIAPTGSTITRVVTRVAQVAEEAEAAGVDAEGPSVVSSLPVTPITLVFKDLRYSVPNPMFSKAAVKKAVRAVAAGACTRTWRQHSIHTHFAVTMLVYAAHFWSRFCQHE
jgi:hypothetical protein